MSPARDLEGDAWVLPPHQCLCKSCEGTTILIPALLPALCLF